MNRYDVVIEVIKHVLLYKGAEVLLLVCGFLDIHENELVKEKFPQLFVFSLYLIHIYYVLNLLA